MSLRGVILGGGGGHSRHGSRRPCPLTPRLPPLARSRMCGAGDMIAMCETSGCPEAFCIECIERQEGMAAANNYKRPKVKFVCYKCEPARLNPQA